MISRVKLNAKIARIKGETVVEDCQHYDCRGTHALNEIGRVCEVTDYLGDSLGDSPLDLLAELLGKGWKFHKSGYDGNFEGSAPSTSKSPVSDPELDIAIGLAYVVEFGQK